MTNYSILTSGGGGGGGGGGKRGIPAFVAQITSRGGERYPRFRCPNYEPGGGGGGEGYPRFRCPNYEPWGEGGGGVTPCVGPNTPNDAYMGSIWVNKFQFGCEFIVREFEYFPA